MEKKMTEDRDKAWLVTYPGLEFDESIVTGKQIGRAHV